MTERGRLEVIPLGGMGEVRSGDDLGALIVEAAAASDLSFEDGDVVVVTQKIVSKSEGAVADCAGEADRLELVMREATRVLRRRDELVVTETRHGFVCANSGVDLSNLPEGKAATLPADSDRSARAIAAAIRSVRGADVGVIISDTFGRAWRNGLTDVAIGVAGISAIDDLRGSVDSQGRELAATEVAVADELAGAAELVMGKATGCPVAVIRGYEGPRGDGSGQDLLRRSSEDLFR